MNNPFYVQPADPNSALQGFNNMLASQDEQKMLAQQKTQKDAVLQEGAAYLQGNDPEALAEWALKNPEQREHFVNAIELQDKLTSRPRVETAKDALSGDPMMAYTKRLEEIRANGGDAPQLEKVLAEGEEAVRSMALKDLAMFDGNALKSFMSSRGDDGGGSVNLKEFDRWRSMPEGKEKDALGLIIGAKSRTESVADYVKRKQAESNIKVEEAADKKTVTGNVGRKQGFIDSGVEAADSLHNINRVSDLLDSVKTGGFNNAALKAKQMFGLETADEAELSAGLGKAILSQLKPIFGAAFTAQEGERLERIEASFGKSTEGNKRLLEQVKKITERAARRGLKAAEDEGDEFTASEIRSAMVSDSEASTDKEFKGQDLQAYNWAKANQDDPRAAAILQKLGAE